MYESTAATISSKNRKIENEHHLHSRKKLTSKYIAHWSIWWKIQKFSPLIRSLSKSSTSTNSTQTFLHPQTHSLWNPSTTRSNHNSPFELVNHTVPPSTPSYQAVLITHSYKRRAWHSWRPRFWSCLSFYLGRGSRSRAGGATTVRTNVKRIHLSTGKGALSSTIAIGHLLI